MKGGIVAMLFAIRALKECGVGLGGRIALMLVPDEETGGARGSAWIAREGQLGRNGVGMLLPEPTSVGVGDANRVALSVRIEGLGQTARRGLYHLCEDRF